MGDNMPVVESNAEMKANMQKKKREEELKSKKSNKLGSDTGAGTKEKISNKMEDVKQDASEKKEDVKSKMKDTKEDISDKIEEVKEEASDKKDEVKGNLEDAKKEAEKQKKKLEEDSEKKGMTPAEKVLNDIITKFRQGSDQINEAISDRSSESETPKVAKKPLIDVLETNETIYLIADISGVKKDDIEIGISKNSVEITAKFKESPEIDDAKFKQKERSYGKTHRKILLSTDIKVKEAKAKYKECTLTLTLPKLVEDITKVNIED